MQKQVGMLLKNMGVLDAETHLDILNPSWAYPQRSEEQVDQITEVDAYEDAKGDKWEHRAGVPIKDEEGEDTFDRVMPDGTPNPRTETTITHIQYADEHNPENAQQWYVHANRGPMESSQWETSTPAVAEGPPMVDANPSAVFGPRPARTAFEAQEDPYPDDSQ